MVVLLELIRDLTMALGKMQLNARFDLLGDKNVNVHRGGQN